MRQPSQGITVARAFRRRSAPRVFVRSWATAVVTVLVATSVMTLPGRPHTSSSAATSVQIRGLAGTRLRLTQVIVAATGRTRGLRVDGRVGEPLTVNLNAGSLRTLGSVAPAHDPTIRLGRDPRAKWPPGGGSHLDRDGADLPANDNRVRSPRRASGRALLAAGQRRGFGA